MARLKRAVWTTCCPQKISFAGYPSLNAVDWDAITDALLHVRDRGRLIGEMTSVSLCRMFPGMKEILDKAVTDQDDPEWSAEWATSRDLQSLHRGVKTVGLIITSYNTRCMVALSSKANSVEIVFDTPTAAHAGWVLAASPACVEYAPLSRVTVALPKPSTGRGTSRPVDSRGYFKCERGETPEQVVFWVYDITRLMKWLPKESRVMSVKEQQDDEWGI